MLARVVTFDGVSTDRMNEMKQEMEGGRLDGTAIPSCAGPERCANGPPPTQPPIRAQEEKP